MRYAATVPGSWGQGAAFAGEVAITFVLMSVALRVSNSARFRRYTGLFMGALVAAFILVEEPLSGMSMNPARTTASALLAGDGPRIVWLYFAAPLVGMLSAAQLYLATRGPGNVICCKFHHDHTYRCIFRCGYCRHTGATGEPVTEASTNLPAPERHRSPGHAHA